MTRRQLREWIYLSLYDELSEHDEHLLQGCLAGDEVARAEYEELKKLHQTIEMADRKALSEEMLWEARQGLRGVLRYEQSRRSLRQRMAERLTMWRDRLPVGWMPQFRVAFAGLAVFALGLFLGSQDLLPGSSPGDGPQENTNPTDILARGDVEISNVRILDADASDGKVEFVFETVQPMQMKGPLSDPQIQKVLAYAVVNEQNPGDRLRAVNAVGAFQQVSQDNEVKNALITALRSDPNSGVRRVAFEALRRYPFDRSIQNAFLSVLANDTNPALRIDAINYLEESTGTQTMTDPTVVDVLRAKMETDDNSYVRNRARMIVEELTNR